MNWYLIVILLLLGSMIKILGLTMRVQFWVVSSLFITDRSFSKFSCPKITAGTQNCQYVMTVAVFDDSFSWIRIEAEWNLISWIFEIVWPREMHLNIINKNHHSYVVTNRILWFGCLGFCPLSLPLHALLDLSRTDPLSAINGSLKHMKWILLLT